MASRPLDRYDGGIYKRDAGRTVSGCPVGYPNPGRVARSQANTQASHYLGYGIGHARQMEEPQCFGDRR